MKIYTKTGDKGKTSLIGGTRLDKSHLRIESYGTIDELNSHIGLLRSQAIDMRHVEFLIQIQNELFTIGSILASDPSKSKMKLPEIGNAQVEKLEREIDEHTKELPEMRFFVLPGGNNAVSFCHIARCVCRRAERNVVHLSLEDSVPEIILIYLNRLSDYLFVLSRKLTFENNLEETPWISGV